MPEASPDGVIGLGIDLVEVSRVARALERWGMRLVHRLMDPEEAAALPATGPERAGALARAIAGKEAASKAIGTGWSRGVCWRDVVVEPGPPPALRLLGRAARAAEARGWRGRCRVRFETRGDLLVAEARLLGHRP